MGPGAITGLRRPVRLEALQPAQQLGIDPFRLLVMGAVARLQHHLAAVGRGVAPGVPAAPAKRPRGGPRRYSVRLRLRSGSNPSG